MFKLFQIKKMARCRELRILGVKVMTVRKDKAGWCCTHLLGIPVLSVYKSKDGHHRVYFCGIRVFNRQPSPKDMISKLQARVKILETNLDITNLPPARGWLRDIQLGNLILLREVDRICQAHHITYWLDSGTLLGAVRHGGYIPWDDDIDIGMLRSDVERFIKCFKEEKLNGYYIEYYYYNFYCVIKVRCRDIPQCWVDIFTYDLYHRRLADISERQEYTELLRWEQRRFPKCQNWKEKTDYCNKWRDEKFLQGRECMATSRPDIFLGAEFMSGYFQSVFFDYEQILPVGRVKFDGYEFNVPNHPHAVLTYEYGDYMNFPTKLYGIGTHATGQYVSLDDRIRLHEFVNK